MSPHFERALRFAEMQQNGNDPAKMHDWTLSQLHALAFEFQQTHDQAISLAASKVDELWAQPPRGEWSFEGVFRKVAEAVKDLRVDK